MPIKLNTALGMGNKADFNRNIKQRTSLNRHGFVLIRDLFDRRKVGCKIWKIQRAINTLKRHFPVIWLDRLREDAIISDEGCLIDSLQKIIQSELTIQNIVSKCSTCSASPIYKYLMGARIEPPHRVLQKWDDVLGTNDTHIKWASICKRTQIFSSVNMRNFHLLFINRVLSTNIHRFYAKKRHNKECAFCTNNAIQTSDHLFWDCPTVHDLWTAIFRKLHALSIEFHTQNMDIINSELDKDSVLLGLYPNSQECLFYIVTIVKQYIFGCNMDDKHLSLNQVRARILWIRDIERKVYTANKKYGAFKKRWKLLSTS